MIAYSCASLSRTYRLARYGERDKVGAADNGRTTVVGLTSGHDDTKTKKRRWILCQRLFLKFERGEITRPVGTCAR
jgi:hypothetical protein